MTPTALAAVTAYIEAALALCPRETNPTALPYREAALVAHLRGALAAAQWRGPSGDAEGAGAPGSPGSCGEGEGPPRKGP